MRPVGVTPHGKPTLIDLETRKRVTGGKAKDMLLKTRINPVNAYNKQHYDVSLNDLVGGPCYEMSAFVRKCRQYATGDAKV